MGKRIAMRKAIRVGETLDSFLWEHPEIVIQRNKQTGYIENIHVPEGTIGFSIFYNRNDIFWIDYVSSSGEHFCFPL